MIPGRDSLKTKKTLTVGGSKYSYYSLKEAAKQIGDISRLPFSLKVLLENLLRFEDDRSVTIDDIKAFADWLGKGKSTREIAYRPARVLMQDFTGVPAVVDLAAMRDAMKTLGEDPEKINPLAPVDLVIDHSVMVDYFGGENAFKKNVDREYERNGERYKFLKWGQGAFDNFRVVPPGTGICHQVNLEYLAQTVWTADVKGETFAYPDTLVGTDSHTTMVNGLSVLGWGVGGIEAEAAMLGQPIYMILPKVVGLKLTGKLPEGATATDLVLTITKLLRDFGVVGKIVEVYGDALDDLAVAERATISNMSPEFGCTDTHWPIDQQTLNYLRKSARDEEHIAMVEAYAKTNMLWRDENYNIDYSENLELDLGTIEPTISGPKRPQDKILLRNAKETVINVLKNSYQRDYTPLSERGWANDPGQVAAAVNTSIKSVPMKVGDVEYNLTDASVVIAAITSCTNTSNPSVMIGAGLVAKKAVELGLDIKPWVKTSLAPGSRVVTEYLKKSNLLPYLEALKFHVVGYGCTTCIGNSGDMKAEVQKAVLENDLVVASTLSGNRNFEARIHPNIKMNFLASPMLVVAYALAGRMDFDFQTEPIAHQPTGEAVYLKDLWPAQAEINEVMNQVLTPEDYKSNYATVFAGDDTWKALNAPTGSLYDWDSKSTYIQEAPFFQNLPDEVPTPPDIKGAKVLLQLGDMVTTDHISPAGKFHPSHPAGQYLTERGVQQKDFNSYGSRRGNHEVMMRGTFANVRIKNKLAKQEGGWTTYHKTGEEMTVFDASMKYQEAGTDLVVIGGKEYGSGSSRDWAAKGTQLLGVKAVIVESYERIHRSNLVGMGVLPLQFEEGQTQDTLGLDGSETYDITGLDNLSANQLIDVVATKTDGTEIKFKALSRLDSAVDVEYYKNGGILNYVLRQFLKGE
jgi:aconitate hydratase